MSIQGCASAKRVVNDVRDAIAQFQNMDFKPDEILRELERLLDEIYNAADSGWW
jgi:hypothetical protein